MDLHFLGVDIIYDDIEFIVGIYSYELTTVMALLDDWLEMFYFDVFLLLLTFFLEGKKLED